MEHKKPYPHSIDYARQNGELVLYYQDGYMNRECVRVIEDAIHMCNYELHRYKLSNAAKAAVDTCGFDRVLYTLAGAIKASYNDGRFSAENHQWACRFSIPHDRYVEFVFHVHRSILDGFVDSVRQAYIEMLAHEVGQYEKSHHMAERNRLTWFHSDFGVFVPNPGITEERVLERYGEIMEKRVKKGNRKRELEGAQVLS